MRQASAPTIALVAQPPGRRLTQSLRYRFLHHLPGLRAAGFRMEALAEAGAEVSAEIGWYLRPEVAPSVSAELELGAPRLQIADLDDLTWAEVADQPMVRSARQSASVAETRRCAAAMALRGFRFATASTQPLAQALLHLVPSMAVAVVPNGLDRRWVAQGRRLHRPWQPGDPRVIRYFAGTSGHDRDLAMIVGPLGKFLREHPEVVFEAVGPVRLEAAALPSGQLRQRQAIPFEALPALLASSWLTIAPLEDTSFNRCKSAIKFLEAAAFGCPCIATAIPDMRRCIAGGAMLCDHEPHWSAALSAMAGPTTRAERSAIGRAWVDANAGADHSTRILVDHLRQWMAPCG